MLSSPSYLILCTSAVLPFIGTDFHAGADQAYLTGQGSEKIWTNRGHSSGLVGKCLKLKYKMLRPEVFAAI